MEDTDQVGEQVHTYDKSKQQELSSQGQQELLGQGQQKGSKQQSSEKSFQGNDFNVSTPESNIGSMANKVLDTVMETEYGQDLTDSMQNIFPKNFQNLTGPIFCEDTSPQTSRNTRSSLSASRRNGFGACSQNEQSDLFHADTSPAKSNDLKECMDIGYQQPKSRTMHLPPNHENYGSIKTPTSRRNLISGEGQYEDRPSSGSQGFLPHQEQHKYIQMPNSRRILLGQFEDMPPPSFQRFSPPEEQCEDMPPGSQQFSPRQEQWRDIKSPGSWSYDKSGPGDSIQAQQKNVPLPVNRKEKKEKKSITTKTFAHGMMDVSLLTSNATQLRAVLSNPKYEFYTLLLWLIGLSIALQLLSAVLLIASDFLKTQVKEKDRKSQGKRKFLNFLSLTLVTVVMSLNVLISAFSSPVTAPQQVSSNGVSDNTPAFSSPEFQTARSEL